MATKLSTAAFLLSATMTASMALAPGLCMAQSATQVASAPRAAPEKQDSAAKAGKSPQPKTQAEYDAYRSAAALTDAAGLEAAATEFAQQFPASELRSVLFQRDMGLYEQASQWNKTIEMARTVLKYDPGNAVALLTAGQVLAERTHDNDLDRNDRLAEANADARSALEKSGEIAPPANLTSGQFTAAMAELRGTAHEVLATVAFKRRDYFTAIREFKLAIAEQKEHTDSVVWLRMGVALDKSGDYGAAVGAVQKAIAASQPGSQVRQLAEQESSLLGKLIQQGAKTEGK